MRRLLQVLLLTLALTSALERLAAAGSDTRDILCQAMLADNDARKHELLGSLAGNADATALELLKAWKEDQLFIYEPATGTRIPVQLTGDKDAGDRQLAFDVRDGRAITGPDNLPLRLNGSDLTAVEHDASLRRVMKEVADLADLSSPEPTKRINAINTLGYAQDWARLPLLQSRLSAETEPRVRTALREAIALLLLRSEKPAERFAGLRDLRELHTLGSVDLVRAAREQATKLGLTEEAEAARTVLVAIDRHKARVNFFGTLFRGLSLGSILLVVALGLAITFGLMKVINMAHGEMIAVGAYTTYVVQNLFGAGLALSPFGQFTLRLPGLNSTGWVYESYFLFALPLSFLTAACAGVLLERSVIRFLYKRPLESLLATWGVSLVLQQLFKLVFGANNVQVASPLYLSGNWTVNDIIFGWNRLFVIGFAVVIVLGTWLVLTRSSLGLLIRAVMQNRGMASCMGVQTERVNMMTFALGSGLAGLAGAFLSQIGNVGPSLGQSYIVDCFMTVVVGGVGNLGGTVISATGIGLLDQSLQQILLNPVLGKILVLAGIILFLQWRPAGIFVTRSRSLDE
jgi:urea transport system permease protein